MIAFQHAREVLVVDFRSKTNIVLFETTTYHLEI